MTEEIFRTLVAWMPVLWLATLSCIVLLWVTLAISLLLVQLRPQPQTREQVEQRVVRSKDDSHPPRSRLPRSPQPNVQPKWHQDLPPQ